MPSRAVRRCARDIIDDRGIYDYGSAKLLYSKSRYTTSIVATKLKTVVELGDGPQPRSAKVKLRARQMLRQDEAVVRIILHR